MDLESLPPGTILTKTRGGWSIRIASREVDFNTVKAKAGSLTLTLAIFNRRLRKYRENTR